MSQVKKIPETKALVLQEFEQVLKKASEKHASDLHLKAGLPPIIRVNGSLYYLGEQNTPIQKQARLNETQLFQFAYALMNSSHVPRYEAGEEIDLGHEVPGVGRFRINLCMQRGHPRMVCRHIPDHIRGISDLGLPPAVATMAQAQRGLILVTGATGSGKSTTLASMIDTIARNRSCHILTIEDPIEFVFKDRKSIITQREVGLDTRGFAHALKYALRQDPDVILVGEMRDEETISMALNAAETGHLVLSTLHTVNATETVNRVLGSVAEGLQASVRSQLCSVLVGVISQRLVKTKDGKGRSVACEVLVANTRVRDLISDPARTHEVSKVIEESGNLGMQSFDQSLMYLFRQGRISKEDALLNCTNVRDFQLRLEGVVAGDWREKENHQELDRAQQVQQVMDQTKESTGPIEIDFEGEKKTGTE